MVTEVLETLLERRRAVAHELADLDTAIQRQLLHPVESTPVRDVSDRWLSPVEAAACTGVTRRWLLAHADEIPGMKRLSRKTIRFSERQLRRFLERRA